MESVQRWNPVHHITRRRTAVCLVGLVLAVGACLCLAGCGSEEAEGQASAEPAMATAPEAEATIEPTPAAQEERSLVMW